MAKEVRREGGRWVAGDDGKLIYIDLIVQKKQTHKQKQMQHTCTNTHTNTHIGIDFCDFMVLRVLGYVLFVNMVFKLHELNSIGISFFSVFIREKENLKQPCRPSCALVIIRSILVSCMSLAELATKGLFLP